MKRYKFLKEGFKSNNGNCVWEIGKWKKHKGKLEMCKSGFHCSKKIYQAFFYVQGEILAEIEARGKKLAEKDKEVYSEMRILRAWKWQKKDSVELAIYCAELCLKNFEKVYPNDKRPRIAIESTKLWLKGKISEKELFAAESAAWSAAESAAGSARSAEWSAGSAVIDKMANWMDKRLKILETI